MALEDGQSSASQSAESSSASSPVAGDGQYIVIEHYDNTGNTITGYSKLQAAEVEAVILEPSQTAVSNALATVQNGEGHFQVAESQYEGVIYTCCVVLVAAVFMCLGAIACRTLMKSFERRG